MTARIHKSFEILAGLHFSDIFYVNSYIIDLTLNVDSTSISEQNIAMERIKFYLHECLEHCVFVNETYTQQIEKYQDVGMRVCTLPEDPYDQVVGIMLMVKLNHITEGRLTITDLSIESKMSDGVSCLHDIEENTGPFAEKGWWNDSTQRISNYFPKNKKVVKLAKATKNEWQDVYLGWEEQTHSPVASEIIFTNFDKTDK